MQHEQAAWKSSIDMHTQNSKLLLYPPAEWIWALEPGFQWFGKGRKKKPIRAIFFRARRFRFFALFFSRSRVFIASRSCARKREKSAGANLGAKVMECFFILRTIPHRRI
jgi:hypothetical protein